MLWTKFDVILFKKNHQFHVRRSNQKPFYLLLIFCNLHSALHRNTAINSLLFIRCILVNLFLVLSAAETSDVSNVHLLVNMLQKYSTFNFSENDSSNFNKELFN